MGKTKTQTTIMIQSVSYVHLAILYDLHEILSKTNLDSHEKVTVA